MEWKLGFWQWRLPLEKKLEVTLSRVSEKDLLENKVFIAFFIDVYDEKEKLNP